MSSPLDALETWHVLAVRVSFPLEDPDDETTSGNGTFDLRSFGEVRDEYTFPYGIRLDTSLIITPQRHSSARQISFRSPSPGLVELLP